MMTKEELINLYNSYLEGTLSNDKQGDLWEGLLDFSQAFLCYVECSDDTKQDILDDLIYNLMVMNEYFKPVKCFNQLRNHLVGKLKNLAKKYNNWENKEQDNGEDKRKEKDE